MMMHHFHNLEDQHTARPITRSGQWCHMAIAALKAGSSHLRGFSRRTTLCSFPSGAMAGLDTPAAPPEIRGFD